MLCAAWLVAVSMYAIRQSQSADSSIEALLKEHGAVAVPTVADDEEVRAVGIEPDSAADRARWAWAIYFITSWGVQPIVWLLASIAATLPQ